MNPDYLFTQTHRNSAMNGDEEMSAPASRLVDETMIDERVTDEKISDELGIETITDLALRPTGLNNPFWK